MDASRRHPVPFAARRLRRSRPALLACVGLALAALVCGDRAWAQQEGDLRLVAGTSPNGERIEVYHDDEWGRICGEGFGPEEAEVACRQLGKSGFFWYGYVHVGSGPIWLSELQCTGTESRLADCPHPGWGVHRCGYEDVGVRCADDMVTGVRVSAGMRQLTVTWLAFAGATGYQVQWKSGDQDYATARQQAVTGQATVSATIPNLAGGTTYTVRVLATKADNTDGTPSREVTGTPWASPGVTLTAMPSSVSEAVGATGMNVTVTGTLAGGAEEEATTVTVRVEEGTARKRWDFWRVEDFTLTISANQASGTATFALALVDDDEPEDAETLRLIGTAAGRAVTGAVLTITDDDSAQVALSVSPDTVAESAATGGQAVIVTGSLIDETMATDTVLTVSVSGGTARANDYVTVADFSLTIATGQASGTATFTLTTINDTDLEPDETLVVAGTGELNVAPAVITISDDAADYAPLRLVDGWAPGNGRLEIFYSDEWGAVCDDYFEAWDGVVACRQLGHSGFVRMIPIGDRAVPGEAIGLARNGRFWLVEVNCSGNESHLSDCSHDAWGVAGCSGFEAVALQCGQGLALSVPDGSAQENADELELVVTLSEASSDVVTVAYATSGGTATAGSDYLEAGGTLTFAAGAIRRTLAVTLIDDAADETDETFTVSLNDVRNGGVFLARATATIHDDDQPSLSIADGSAEEGDGTLELVVTLQIVALEDAVTVAYATSDGTATVGTDYTAASGTLTFATDTRQTVAVTLIDDADTEQDETFTVTLSNPQGATLGDASGTGTIENDDEPAVTVRFGPGPYTAAEGGAAAAVLVSLSADPEREVVIPLTLRNENGAGSGDYTVSARRLTLNSARQVAAVTVTAVDDAVDDDWETMQLGFGKLPPRVTAGNPSTARVGLSDDDERGVRVSEQELTVLEGGSNGYTVVLTSQPKGAAVTFTVTVPAGTDVSASPRALTFTAQTWDTARTVTVRALEDMDALTDAAVSLAHAVNGADYELRVPGLVVTVAENDTPALSMAGASGAESAGELGFVVSLNLESSDEVTVKYATADGTAQAGADYTEASGTLTLAAGAMRGTVTVAVLDDTADEAEEERFTVTLSAASGALLAVAQATGVIEDDDEPQVEVRFGAASYAAAEGGGVAVEVSLSGDPEREVEIPLTVQSAGGAEAGDYTVSAQRLTLNSGRQTAQVTVTAVDDAVDDDGESVELGFGTLPSGVTAGSPGTAEVSLGDDDERGVRVSEQELTVLEGGSNVYTVELASEPTVQVIVTVGVPGGTDVSASPRALTFTAQTWDTALTVMVSAVEDADALADATVSLTHAASGGDYGAVTGPAVTVTVVENDTPALSLAGASGAESAGELGFEVSLSLASAGAVTVEYATADGTAQAGTDYTEASGTLTFAAGELRRTVAVEVLDDAADETEEETFTVTLSGASGALLAVAQATGTIADDDEPQVEVRFGAASYAAAEGGGVAVEVSLSGDPEREVEIPLTVAAVGGASAGDYAVTAQRLTLSSARQTAQVTVTAVDDAVDDDGESVELGFGDAARAG